MNKSVRGFTIVELLIVIIVIAVLAAISIVAYNGLQGRAKFNKINADLVSMRKVIEMYKAEYGVYPTFGTGYRYQRSSGDNFIPDVVPKYVTRLPEVTSTPYGAVTNDTYIYSANSTGTGYVLQRLYQPNVPDSEWSYVPAAMKQSGVSDRYGYGFNYSGY